VSVIAVEELLQLLQGNTLLQLRLRWPATWLDHWWRLVLLSSFNPSWFHHQSFEFEGFYYKISVLSKQHV